MREKSTKRSAFALHLNAADCEIRLALAFSETNQLPGFCYMQCNSHPHTAVTPMGRPVANETPIAWNNHLRTMDQEKTSARHCNSGCKLSTNPTARWDFFPNSTTRLATEITDACDIPFPFRWYLKLFFIPSQRGFAFMTNKLEGIEKGWTADVDQVKVDGGECCKREESLSLSCTIPLTIISRHSLCQTGTSLSCTTGVASDQSIRIGTAPFDLCSTERTVLWVLRFRSSTHQGRFTLATCHPVS
ncbi:hypothetical protein T07_13894 [Trichinella nelsoni]|uniref:Uncharacterized protein n=1 Tax=Trichinella nelsoni TaxID=6336 RepID=A0A0V0RUH6_9BILA|nr:hypothetical protein T07_13894 [Trichinella nelsoni]